MEVDRGAIRAGDAALDPQRRTLSVDGREVGMTVKEFELARLLLGEPGRVWSRAEFLQQVWGVTHQGYSRSVDAHVNRLRRKLGESGRHIGCVYGIGYRWQEEVAHGNHTAD